jgi:hypothetical protein
VLSRAGETKMDITAPPSLQTGVIVYQPFHCETVLPENAPPWRPWTCLRAAQHLDRDNIALYFSPPWVRLAVARVPQVHLEALMNRDGSSCIDKTQGVPTRRGIGVVCDSQALAAPLLNKLGLPHPGFTGSTDVNRQPRSHVLKSLGFVSRDTDG